MTTPGTLMNVRNTVDNTVMCMVSLGELTMAAVCRHHRSLSKSSSRVENTVDHA